ncbi:MAG: hypothetical protein HY619_06165 [Thaumarchaeota archaeon]|nr:hypothetical protein [Nitrososphaerota archaeon]
MGRSKIIAGIWLGGFLLGFVSYLTYPMLKETFTAIILPLLQTESQIAGALVAGLVSSMVTMMVVLLLSHASGPKRY